MNFRTMLGFQFGAKAAIEAVARSRSALPTGVALVLLTGIARNYDQKFILESPLWLIGPLIFSFFSGTFLFVVVYWGFIRRHLEAAETLPSSGQWRRFMALFWMTAPVAWLYAIPVERFLSSYRAAQANLTLLAIVSLWRVLLMARIISVLQQVDFSRAVAWVLVPACLEVLAVIFFGPTFSRQIMAGMGGMLNSPEVRLMDSALGYVFVGALIVLPLTLIVLGMWRFCERLQPFPEPLKEALPVGALLLLGLAWTAVAIVPQLEQYRYVTHAKLVEAGRYRESVEYLARHRRADFPASRRLEPDPYEYQVWERLPGILACLESSDPAWIQQLYIEHLGAMFSHRWLRCTPDSLVQVFSALERLPDGRGWIERNRAELPKVATVLAPQGSEQKATTNRAREQLTNLLERLGVRIEGSR